jgi:hypothetical protein
LLFAGFERPRNARRTPGKCRFRGLRNALVFSDQLLSLREIVLMREVRSGHRVRLGDVVQEALDAFIAAERVHEEEREEEEERRKLQKPEEPRIDPAKNQEGTR